MSEFMEGWPVKSEGRQPSEKQQSYPSKEEPLGLTIAVGGSTHSHVLSLMSTNWFKGINAVNVPCLACTGDRKMVRA
jgi:hypothetical protein